MSENDRLTRLEERYAHLQRHTAEQDKVMLELGEELGRLKKDLAALRARLSDAAGSGSEPPEPQPPHY